MQTYGRCHVRLTKLVPLFLLGISLQAALVVTGCNVTTGPSGTKWGTTPQGTACTLTVSPASVVTYSSTGTVTCSPSCSAATSVTVTPQASVAGLGNERGGCPATPVGSVYNTRVDALPVSSNSANWMTYLGTQLGSDKITFQPAWGFDIGSNSTPTTTYTFHYTSSQNGLAFLNPPRPHIHRESGVANYDSNFDHHWTQVNKDTCQMYETYGDHDIFGGTNAASGVTYSGLGYDLAVDPVGSTTAGGALNIPDTLTLADIQGLRPPHMLRFTLSPGYIQTGVRLWPGNPIGGTACTTASCPAPYGSVFRLKASWCSANLNTTSYPGFQYNIVRDLCQGGFIIDDAGGGGDPIPIQTDMDAWLDPAARAALAAVSNTIAFVTNSEVVDMSSLEVAPASSEVNPANGHVIPATYNVVTINDGTDPAQSIPISVQPVSIGTLHQAFGIVAGTSAAQLAWWVNGTANQSVTWSKVSGTGSVTSGGLYTPTASTSSVVTDILQGVAAADSNAKIQVTVTVIPADSAHPGGFAVGMQLPTQTCTTATCTRTYVADSAVPSAANIYCCAGQDYPSTWISTDAPVWTYGWHSSGGGDIEIGDFYVPNGNYKIGYMMAQQGHYGSYDPTGAITGYTQYGGLSLLTANGSVLGLHDFGLASGYMERTPDTFYGPVTVSDHWLSAAVRMYSATGLAKFGLPWLAGLTVDTDAESAHWAIDTEGQTSVAAGGTLQMTQIDWFTGAACPNSIGAGSNASCTWSVDGVTGGNSTVGTISSLGLYTAPTGTPSVTQTHAITVSDGTHSATVSLVIPGTTYPIALY